MYSIIKQFIYPGGVQTAKTKGKPVYYWKSMQQSHFKNESLFKVALLYLHKCCKDI